MKRRRGIISSLLMIAVACVSMIGVNGLEVAAKEDMLEDVTVEFVGVSRADNLSHGEQAFHLKPVIEPNVTYMVQAVITNYGDTDVENVRIQLRLPAEARVDGQVLDGKTIKLSVVDEEDGGALLPDVVKDDVILETDANLAIEYIPSSAIMTTIEASGERTWESNMWAGSLGQAAKLSTVGATYLNTWRDLPAQSTIIVAWGFRTHDLEAYEQKRASMEPIEAHKQGIYVIPERFNGRMVAELETAWTSEDCWRIMQQGKIDTTAEELPEQYAIIAAVDIPRWLPENDDGENRWVLRTGMHLSYHDGREIAPADWPKAENALDGYRVVTELGNCQLIYEAAETLDYAVQQDDVLNMANIVKVLYWNAQTGKVVPMKETWRVRDAFGSGYALNQEDGIEAGEHAFIVFLFSVQQ